MEALFILRTTAQHVDNTLAEWLEKTTGSVARFQILVQLWAAKGSAVPHQDITATLRVTRATVSDLMAALERGGLVRSSADGGDRRRLLATMTSKGEKVISQALGLNITRMRSVFRPLSATELKTLTSLLQRVRDGLLFLSDEIDRTASTERKGRAVTRPT
jgi:DNA-binding MarR family transcriptional regulator